MAGAGMIPSEKGGRRSLDAAINLVPFIDLLSCCISFLLITAVWVNLGRMQVAPSDRSHAEEREAVPGDPRVSLRIDRGGYVLTRSSGEEVVVPRSAGQLDPMALARALGTVRAALPNQHDLDLRASDGIHYAELIATMDVAHAAAFHNIQVQPSQR